MDFDQYGFVLRTVKVTQASDFIRNLKRNETISAIITVEVGERKRNPWRLYLVRTCNEFARYVTGIAIGLTFNPVHFYNKLLRYDNKRNYRILSQWRRKDGAIRRG